MNYKLLAIILLAVFLTGTAFALEEKIKNSFEVSPILFKVVLDKGETISSSLIVKNAAESSVFNIKPEYLDDFVFLNETSFALSSNESREINLSLSDGGNSYGVHLGSISVSNTVEEKQIPVIISVHTKNQSFAINLNAAPENKQLGKKESLAPEIKFFNLKDSQPHTVKVDYQIFNLKNERLFSESEELTIGAKSAFTKKFPLPPTIELGDYVFAVSLNYTDTITTASYLFSVVNKKQTFSIFNINFLAVIVALFVVLTFFLILCTLYERSKLLSKLKRQHKVQIQNYSNGILNEKKKCLAQAKTIKQKKRIIHEFDDAKEKILSEMKKQHKSQIKELKSLKEKKIKDKKAKLLQWSKEGYSNAIESAKISNELKGKLAVLKTAYDAGFIKKDSYVKGMSDIKSANAKLKRNLYK